MLPQTLRVILTPDQGSCPLSALASASAFFQDLDQPSVKISTTVKISNIFLSRSQPLFRKDLDNSLDPMDSTTRNNTKATASAMTLQDLNDERRRRSSDARKALDLLREAVAEARAQLEANINHDDPTAIALTLEVVDDQLDVFERQLAAVVELEMQAGTKTGGADDFDPFESKEKYALVVALLTASLIACLAALVYKATEN